MDDQEKEASQDFINQDFNFCNVLRLTQALNLGKKTHESTCSQENRGELVAQENSEQNIVGRMFL